MVQEMLYRKKWNLKEEREHSEGRKLEGKIQFEWKEQEEK